MLRLARERFCGGGMVEGIREVWRWVFRVGRAVRRCANQCVLSWVRRAPLEGMPWWVGEGLVFMDSFCYV